MTKERLLIEKETETGTHLLGEFKLREADRVFDVNSEVFCIR